MPQPSNPLPAILLRAKRRAHPSSDTVRRSQAGCGALRLGLGWRCAGELAREPECE